MLFRLNTQVCGTWSHLPLTSNISLFPTKAEQIERIRTWWLHLKSEKCVIKSGWWLFLREKSLWLGKCWHVPFLDLGDGYIDFILIFWSFLHSSLWVIDLSIKLKKEKNFKNVFIIRKKSFISEKLFFQSCLPQIMSILRILAQSSK